MIDALISGRIYGQPKQGAGKNGSPYVTAKVRAAAGDGEILMVSVIAFADAACQALLALGDGDSVALSGSLTPKVWTDREGAFRPALDMQAHAVLTAYHLKSRTSPASAAPENGDLSENGDLPV